MEKSPLLTTADTALVPILDSVKEKFPPQINSAPLQPL